MSTVSTDVLKLIGIGMSTERANCIRFVCEQMVRAWIKGDFVQASYLNEIMEGYENMSDEEFAERYRDDV